ncbi:hypothetical protein [Spirosoma utsteinense]|uniref:Uncharacterized protein n=1 Tax=Spirosoma utsteinense TaxID=2585773 RepID=A0ABR6WF17_9BACT|nr:hypothetical protein [Spirosoma utsteinense]MBC3787448.1 hypothetical protein [Spirosoma utsteinense]MBC3794532.1 hypothetical protein [Spirosoma utsteinense]
MTTQEHINNFSLTLTKILNQELELGNKIIETSKGWPDNDTIIIFLGEPFKITHNINNICYRNIEDPHYWKEEYFDTSTKHVLACKF